MNMYKDILKFWFEEIEQSLWWVKDEQFDQLIIERFSKVHTQAIRCELFEWRKVAEGRLAEIIIIDQFSRNMFRDSPLSFAYDSLALALSQEAILVGADKELSPIQRSFLYLPFMHSESLKIHEVAMDLYKKNGIKANLDFEIKHKEILEKFGRYPHRNKILGRMSTDKEIEFFETARICVLNSIKRFSNTMDNNLSIDGNWPKLEGTKLQEMMCDEMYYEGKLEELANVIHIKVNDKWLRLYFDHDIIFWRSGNFAPVNYEIPEYDSFFKTTDVAKKFDLKGETIVSLNAQIVENGVEVIFVFSNGKKIIFSSINDVSNYRT